MFALIHQDNGSNMFDNDHCNDDPRNVRAITIVTLMKHCDHNDHCNHCNNVITVVILESHCGAPSCQHAVLAALHHFKCCDLFNCWKGPEMVTPPRTSRKT